MVPRLLKGWWWAKAAPVNGGSHGKSLLTPAKAASASPVFGLTRVKGTRGLGWMQEVWMEPGEAGARLFPVPIRWEPSIPGSTAGNPHPFSLFSIRNTFRFV